jgi:hypothetical protein
VVVLNVSTAFPGRLPAPQSKFVRQVRIRATVRADEAQGEVTGHHGLQDGTVAH